MSKVTEMANAEADAVEAELAAEADNEAQAAEEKAQIEHAHKLEYHVRKVYELTGQEMPEDGILCPTCHFGVVNVAMQNDPRAATCDTCAGLGRTLTGSFVEGNHERVCPECNGQGYRERVTIPQPAPATDGAWQAPVVPYTPPTAVGV